MTERLKLSGRLWASDYDKPEIQIPGLKITVCDLEYMTCAVCTTSSKILINISSSQECHMDQEKCVDSFIQNKCSKAIEHILTIFLRPVLP